MMPPLLSTSATFIRSRSWGFMGFILKITAILIQSSIENRQSFVPEAFRN
jgi:hypothetical protein